MSIISIPVRSMMSPPRKALVSGDERVHRAGCRGTERDGAGRAAHWGRAFRLQYLELDLFAGPGLVVRQTSQASVANVNNAGTTTMALQSTTERDQTPRLFVGTRLAWARPVLRPCRSRSDPGVRCTGRGSGSHAARHGYLTQGALVP